MEGLTDQQKQAIGVVQARFTTSVFMWMVIGLLLTAVSASVAVRTPVFDSLLRSNGMFILLIAEILLVVFLSSRIHKMSVTTARLSFGVYSVLSGVTLAAIVLIYTTESIALTFGITAGVFATMGVYGYVTKTDLLKLRSLFIMGIVGLIIASVVNFFMDSSGLYWIITYAGVLIFTGLVAYDVQKIKVFALQGLQSEEDYNRFVILGALTLYLDFVNLFLMLLRLFGKRR